MPDVRRTFAGPPPEAELTPCSYVAADAIVDGDPQEREHLYLTTPDGSYTVGVWEAQPYAERFDGYVGNEFCTVLRGRLTLTSDDGTTQTFTAGDSYVMEKGWSGEFRVEEPFLKSFALSVTP
ncbi:cupin domain-containing protein [Pimelobacter simplex]|uniref:cupin domain-containing protein n=1 Tax=Nocardioides simplex TaxID=2045 RepID=UPI003AAD07C3